MFEGYFHKEIVETPEGQKVEAYTPRLIAFATSKIVDGKESFDLLEAPAIAMVPLHTLAIETIEVEFEAKLSNFTAADLEQTETEVSTTVEDDTILRRTFRGVEEIAHEIEVMVKGESFESSASPAKVKVTFKLHDAPEGSQLLQEEMLDYLRKK